MSQLRSGDDIGTSSEAPVSSRFVEEVLERALKFYMIFFSTGS